MLNEISIRTIEESSTESLCGPLYDSYCFSRIPATIINLLTGDKTERLPSETTSGEGYDLVILFLVDGFGWRFFKKYADRFPFLKRVLEQGIVSKLTSQFPSTTAAHVTCINTGLPVAESGVYEWFYYEPLVDRVIAPLLFSYAGDHSPGTLKESGIPSEEFYPRSTLYETLHEKGIASYVMQNSTIAFSPYSQAMFKGAFQVPYNVNKEAMDNLVDIAMRKSASKNYVYLYFGDIDSAGHRHGIDSQQFEMAVVHFWELMEEQFFKQLKQLDKKVACLVTADHGMVPVDPKNTYFLNQQFPEIQRYLKRNKAGDLIAPAGSCRDFFLHIQEDRLDECKEILQELLKERANVATIWQLINAGFFGPKMPSANFLNRVGNLVILPHEGEAVWWYVKHHFEQHFYGAHGGLSRNEMEIPLFFLPL
jgi:predicted AlkP superfamily pyrophosphatase or phosphodiesterase